MKWEDSEVLLGHAFSYNKPSAEHLKEEYLKAVPFLCIDEKYSLRWELEREHRSHEDEWQKARLENLEQKQVITELLARQERLERMADAIWDGLQVAGGNIIQPILIYGCVTSSNCQNGWQFAGAWLDASTGTEAFSTPYSATPGATIQGTVSYLSRYAACGNIPVWLISVYDTSSGVTSTLGVCGSQSFQEAVAGALEVKDISACNQMPGSGSDTFSSISYATSPSGGSVTDSTFANSNNFCIPTTPAQWVSGNLDLSWKTS